MDYEKKLNELQKVLEKMECSETTLSEGVELFEQGVKLTKECLSVLNDYRNRISAIENEVEELLNNNEK